MTGAERRADPPGPPVEIVRTCLRDGGGGSPTAVVDEAEFAGCSARRQGRAYAAFDPGPVELRTPGATERDLVLPALGIPRGAAAPGIRVASVGRPRLLVPVRTRSALRAVSPDFGRLRDACDRLRLLGCYVYSVPTSEGRAAVRMSAPSIGVDEDIANANSTACLAAHLAGRGPGGLAVDMGGSLGSPSTITATVRQGPAGPLVRLGGTAEVTDGIRLPAPRGGPAAPGALRSRRRPGAAARRAAAPSPRRACCGPE
ncbi:PhzF family phenazine biosynthesis protein [Streptomyces sp. NPDC004126]|uniref:PhzF family phenazine biosynthesis protein n=1 Tax=Streptomyces sp. NPDC004126 TaxID=3390695 RepID=UPI003D043D53